MMSGRCRAEAWHERLTVAHDGEDGAEQFAQSGDQGDLGQLAAADQAIVEGLEPRIATYSREQRHPQGGAQAGVADRTEAGPLAAALARLLEAGHDADIGGQRRGIAETAEIAEFGDEPSGGVGADAFDRGEERADLVIIELAGDVAVQFPDASAQQVQVLAGVADLDAVGGTMMVADRDLGRRDQRRGQLRTDLVDAVVDQLSETSRRSSAGRLVYG